MESTMPYVIATAILLIAVLKFFQVKRRSAESQQGLEQARVFDEPERVEAAGKQARLFIGASTLLIQRQHLSPAEHRATHLYLAGAVDALASHYQLSERDTLLTINSSLRNFGLTAAEACDVLTALPGVYSQPSDLAAMTTGGRSILAWLSGSDANAPLALTDLLASMNTAKG